MVRASVGRAAVREFDIAYPLPRIPGAADAALHVARAALNEASFEAAWAAGQTLTLGQAVDEALVVVGLGNAR